MPALDPGQAAAECVECGPVPLDALTLELVPHKLIRHYECNSPVIIFVGRKTSLAIHAHECGHAILIPYMGGTEMPPTPGCRHLHQDTGKGGE